MFSCQEMLLRQLSDHFFSIFQNRNKIQLNNNQKKRYKLSTMNEIQSKNIQSRHFDKFCVGKENQKYRSSSIILQNQENQLNHKFLNFLPSMDRPFEVELTFQNEKSNSKWTREEAEKFIGLYLIYGTSWKLIASQLEHNVIRSQKQVKNKYNNSLKRVARILNKQESKIFKNARRTITLDLLKSMIDFVNLLEKTIKQYNLTPNYTGKFFIFREQILRFSLFTQDYYNESQLNELILIIKSLNSKIKCFGMFKKSFQKKVWKIKIRALLSINQFDKVFVQKPSQLMLNLQSSSKDVKTADEDQSIPEEEAPDMEISLMGIQDYCNSFLKESTDLERQYYNILGQQYNFPDSELLYLF